MATQPGKGKIRMAKEELNCAYDLATETKRLINGMIAYLRKYKS
jgi:hypothetical protein